MSRARESRPGGPTRAASESVGTLSHDTGHAPDPHEHDAPVHGLVRLGPAEALDDCPDCHGAVQRHARHSEGLGELWETPLSINTHDQPYSPRGRGPGIFTLAMDTYAQGVAR